jgi:Transcriptional regulator, effector-binding domain/component
MQCSLVTSEASLVAAVRYRGRPIDVGRAFDHLMEWAGVHHVEPWGPLVGVYEDAVEGSAEVVAEAWMPLPAEARGMDPADPEVALKEVAAETVACCTHHGFPDELAGAISALFAWIDEQGLERSAPVHRQVYRETPPGQPGAWVVDIQVPVDELVSE